MPVTVPFLSPLSGISSVLVTQALLPVSSFPHSQEWLCHFLVRLVTTGNGGMGTAPLSRFSRFLCLGPAVHSTLPFLEK